MQLTDEQTAIIKAGIEHSLITAVPGSGKTTTLAHRICFLLNQGQNPQRLLVLMFNRAAKLDFETKLSKIAKGKFTRLPEIRTYHAMGLRLYRRFIKEGILQTYSGDVLTEHEINFQLFNLMRRYCPPEREDDIRRNKKEFIELAAKLLDMSKTTLQPIEDTFDNLGYRADQAFLITIVRRFEQWRKQQSRISFADMLFEPVACIRANPRLSRLVANKMDMILVDEYQDTNEIQHLLLTYIAGQRAKVTVVGDPDQTIYEFRGAQPEFILHRFAKEFPSPERFSLTYTFRYGHQVALLANHLITYNDGRKNVCCRAHPDNSATRVDINDSADEIKALLADINQQQQDGMKLTDIAIMFRVWSQAVAIELALLAAQIPYQIAHGKGALANKEVNQVIALLELASGRLRQHPINIRQEFFFQLLRFPHIGLKDDSLRVLARGLAGQEGFWGDYMLNWMPTQLHLLQKKKIRSTAMAWQELKAGKTNSAQLLTKYIKESELVKNMSELALTHETAEERLQNVLSIVRYLEALNLPPLETLQHFDKLRTQAKAQQRAVGLTLSTMHQTKGLEWPCVMITGLNEHFLPYTMRNQENFSNHLQSERRLLYVAMTRVRDRLFLYIPKRSARDSTDKETQASRFMDEMSPKISLETGQFLEAHQLQQPIATADVTPQQSVVRFKPKAGTTTVAIRYLEWHGITAPPMSPPPTSTEKTENQDHVWDASAVRHAILGHGKVIKDLGDAFQVSFADGQSMNFSKKSAHLYFIATETH